jgi:hypothetical protein
MQPALAPFAWPHRVSRQTSRRTVRGLPGFQLTTFTGLPLMNAARLAAVTARRRQRAEFIADKKAAGRLQDLAAAEGPNRIRRERIGKAID